MLQSMEPQRVGHDLGTKQQQHVCQRNESYHLTEKKNLNLCSHSAVFIEHVLWESLF